MKDIRDTENTLILGIFLCIVAALSALLLGYFSELTGKPIAEAQARTFAASLQQVLPAFTETQEAGTFDGVKFYRAHANSELVGIAAEVTEKTGYAGPITVLVGFLPDGSIRSVVVTRHGETPGLGSTVCERVRLKTLKTLFQPEPAGLPPNRILDAFSGRSASVAPFRVDRDGGDIPSKTGATVSSRAVTAAVSKAAQVLHDNRAALFGKPEKKDVVTPQPPAPPPAPEKEMVQEATPAPVVTVPSAKEEK